MAGWVAVRPAGGQAALQNRGPARSRPPTQPASHPPTHPAARSQTDGSEPNKLVVVTADVCKPRVPGTDRSANWAEQAKSPHVGKPTQVVYHPGEVNKIRELPQHPSLVVTHTDAPQLYVWNLDRQPNRAQVRPPASPTARTHASGSRPPVLRSRQPAAAREQGRPPAWPRIQPPRPRICPLCFFLRVGAFVRQALDR